AQGCASSHCGNDRKSIQIDSLPGPFLDLPAEYGQLADQAGFGVSEAGTRIDIGRTGLDVVAINVLRGDTTGKTKTRGKEKRNKLFHSAYLILCTIVPPTAPWFAKMDRQGAAYKPRVT